MYEMCCVYLKATMNWNGLKNFRTREIWIWFKKKKKS